MKGVLVSLIVFFSVILISFSFSCYYSYFYPFEYENLIVENAKEYSVEPELIASIINVESSYNPYARSNKGALGLMQVLPSTAEWICGRIGIEYNEDWLYDPAFNIKIGTCYVSYLMDYFKDESLALCAYNAGMGNVNRWLEKSEYSKDGQSLDAIPFKETENYLKSVQKNRNVYKNKF